eukprot:CAMPEP_0119372766 /NCGR_PEP_ID=MMETSP1334-20130426/21708_1 /TAXON_ID=127549 /ORGANISM="Calcidiscus leptoporus, Strain RCC1130" /LENGTH=151 /DNA_ID=CAMNT_0007390329 /DNA_START=338 /DNA_END=790 /DNA_ORIENTATION=-
MRDPFAAGAKAASELPIKTSSRRRAPRIWAQLAAALICVVPELGVERAGGRVRGGWRTLGGHNDALDSCRGRAACGDGGGRIATEGSWRRREPGAVTELFEIEVNPRRLRELLEAMCGGTTRDTPRGMASSEYASHEPRSKSINPRITIVP